MRKLRILLEYDGTNYSGWQFQPDAVTLQGLLEDAIRRATGGQASGEMSRVTGAGRTDAGVHALGQVATFRTNTRLPDEVLHRAINAHLPRDVRILALEEADEHFHVRHSSTAKRYVYLIQNGSKGSALLENRAWRIPGRMDVQAMREGLRYLHGRHDFSSFQASGCAAQSPIRDLRLVEVIEERPASFLGMRLDVRLIRLTLEADGFLRHMVRNIAGLAAEVGRGKMPAGEIRVILEARDRRKSAPTAPAHGLYLERIFYPEGMFLDRP